jgi:hypothetical protein
MKDLAALESTVHYAIGKAAMCWRTMPQGEYDDEKANEIAEELIRVIRETMMDAGLDKALSDEKPGPRKKRKDVSLETLR